MDDLLDELAKEISENYNDYDGKTESSMQAAMADRTRKRKKDKNVITLSSGKKSNFYLKMAFLKLSSVFSV